MKKVVKQEEVTIYIGGKLVIDEIVTNITVIGVNPPPFF